MQFSETPGTAERMLTRSACPARGHTARYLGRSGRADDARGVVRPVSPAFWVVTPCESVGEVSVQIVDPRRVRHDAVGVVEVVGPGDHRAVRAHPSGDAAAGAQGAVQVIVQAAGVIFVGRDVVLVVPRRRVGRLHGVDGAVAGPAVGAHEVPHAVCTLAVVRSRPGHRPPWGAGSGLPRGAGCASFCRRHRSGRRHVSPAHRCRPPAGDPGRRRPPAAASRQA